MKWRIEETLWFEESYILYETVSKETWITNVIVNSCQGLPVVLMYHSLSNSYDLVCGFVRIQWQASHYHLHVLVWFTVQTWATQSIFSPSVKVFHNQPITVCRVSFFPICSCYSCAHMQCPAVSTQQLSMRTPPHTCLNIWFELFGLTCRETCQGIPPGLTFRPPKILVMGLFGWAFPQPENCRGREGIAGGASLGFWIGGDLVVTTLGTGLAVGLGLGLVRAVVGAGGTISIGTTSENKNIAEEIFTNILINHNQTVLRSVKANLLSQNTLTHRSSSRTTLGLFWRSTKASDRHLDFYIIKDI